MLILSPKFLSIELKIQSIARYRIMFYWQLDFEIKDFYQSKLAITATWIYLKLVSISFSTSLLKNFFKITWNLYGITRKSRFWLQIISYSEQPLVKKLFFSILAFFFPSKERPGNQVPIDRSLYTRVHKYSKIKLWNRIV